MTVVTEDLDLPTGADPTGLTVTIAVAPLGEAAYTTAPVTVIDKVEITPDPDGSWSADLVPNDDLTPTGTRYRIVVTDGRRTVVGPRYIEVPSSGPVTVQEILTDPPAAVEFAALAVHAAKRALGGHLPDAADDGDVPIWDDGTSTWVAGPQSGGPGGGLANVVEDTTPQLGGDLDANGHTIIGLDASATAKGIVELATVAETDTGTDATRAVTPAGLAGSALAAAAAAAIPSSEKGAAGGVASLDGTGVVPDGQIPDGIARDSEVAGLISAAIDALLDGAPGALDTLNELAAAIGDDASFAATVTAALAGKQPLDSDLTAIAALTTTSFGRSLLELASAAAARIALGLVIGTDVQAHDGDLDAIAALTTTAFGRGLLTLANSAVLTAAVDAATDTAAGKVELATITETTTGTDTGRAVTPDGLAGSAFGKRIIAVQVTDPNGASIVNGNGQAFLRVPALLNGWSLDAVGAAVTTVSSSGLPTIQLVNLRAGTGTPNMLSTALTIDANEKDSATAATAAVISAGTTSSVPDKQVATGDQIRLDVSGGPTGAKGLIVQLTFVAP